VVDNDDAESAESTVVACKEKSLINTEYYSEPEKNISLARNKAVQNAKGNYVAFIDDDEYPVQSWLLNLYETLHKYQASGVLGPVKPHFEINPPPWIIKGKLCERDSFDTGIVLRNHIHTRTGNVLLTKQILNEEKTPFDPEYGKTGGEDVDFFKRMIKRRHVFVWYDEASVYESLPPKRLKRTDFLKRALMRGVVNSKNASFISGDTLKSLTAIVLYTTALPFLLLTGHHLFMKYLIKDCDHIGKLLGICGLEVVKEKRF
jgi:glycosyltransferase involved in cell wall biosynthesis